MLTSVLLYLEDADQAGPVIDCGVSLAREVEARVRGLTLIDTRDSEAAKECESAGYLSMVNTRQALCERLHEGAQSELSKACLDARLNFDVRRTSGDPLEVLPNEARFHDLVITSLGSADDGENGGTAGQLSLGDLAALLRRGVQPLLVLPARQKAIERVLMVYDGSEAAGRTIRSFLGLGVMRHADYRLLAVGPTEAAARESLTEMAEYCSARCDSLETGCVTGKVRQVLVPYAAKWEADLVVLGVSRSHRLLQRLLGKASLDLVAALDCALFVQA